MVVSLERVNKVDTGKHRETAVLIYFLVLLLLVCINIVKDVNILDVLYFVVVVCCVFKYCSIIYKDRK